MVPTVDIGSIAAIGAVLTFLGKVWGYFVKARDFLLQNIALVILGSKIWATAFFIGAVVIILALQNNLISSISEELANWVWAGIGVQYNMPFEQSVLGQIFPFSDMVGLVTYGVLQTASYLLFIANIAFFKRCFGYFLGIVSSWKT